MGRKSKERNLSHDKREDGTHRLNGSPLRVDDLGIKHNVSCCDRVSIRVLSGGFLKQKLVGWIGDLR